MEDSKALGEGKEVLSMRAGHGSPRLHEEKHPNLAPSAAHIELRYEQQYSFIISCHWNLDSSLQPSAYLDQCVSGPRFVSIH